ncbi:MAG: transferrin receptor-like dimerization domain-containing protein [Panacibacter sp.]
MNKLFFTTVAFCSVHILLNAQTKNITGFTDQSAAQQFALEQKFDAGLSAVNIGNTIKELSSKPHNLGSAGSKSVAQNIYNRFKIYGFDVRIDEYKVLFPTPKTRILEITGSTTYKALLKEPALKEDATSGQADQLPTYNAWSADGDVTGQLVFVNYGLPSDYEILDRLGIDVRGKIVIAKYGRSWRGIKPKVAQEHGAIGCIIYSDPMDDGYFQGDVYPKGAYKSEYGVQRGSVMDMVIYPGDPLTPGVGATENAERIPSHNEAPNLLKIPVLPISYHDAQPLLMGLEGPVAPAGWRGALPFTYHIGPGKATVHLKMEFDWKMVPCYDVIAMVKGAQYPDEWVVRGNHHDAWVNGASDPISGQAALLEEAKSIGELLKTGWKPKRTLVYCAWDGEEPGLLGSTEWAEDHGKELQQKAVLYINSDANERGFLGAGGSHALETFVTEVARDVNDPQTNVSVLQRLKALDIINASSANAKKEAMQKNDLNLDALGSGSDFSSFLQHLGVPSLDFGFGGEGGGGDYHSIYDSYDDYRRFKDPSFEYGVALSKTAGHAALRMANADLLPFDFRSLYSTINGYAVELINTTNMMRENTATENEIINSNSYRLATDTALHITAPQAKAEVPYIDFSSLQNALIVLQKSTDSLSARWNKTFTANSNMESFNDAMYKAEQQLLIATGLPRRGWYKHAIYAPGFYTGYGVKTLPGIREAIEQRNWKEASEQINVAAAVINNLATHLNSIH